MYWVSQTLRFVFKFIDDDVSCHVRYVTRSILTNKRSPVFELLWSNFIQDIYRKLVLKKCSCNRKCSAKCDLKYIKCHVFSYIVRKKNVGQRRIIHTALYFIARFSNENSRKQLPSIIIGVNRSCRHTELDANWKWLQVHAMKQFITINVLITMWELQSSAIQVLNRVLIFLKMAM